MESDLWNIESELSDSVDMVDWHKAGDTHIVNT